MVDNLKNRVDFLNEVKSLCPEIISELNEQDGLMSFELDVFVRFLQNKINEGDKESVSQGFKLLNNYYLYGSDELRQLIGNAISEDITFEDSKKNSRSWALPLLPMALERERASWRRFMNWDD